MIYDCFSYNGEKDLFEIRLNHHSPFVDKFIITECPWTYSGIKKPLYYDEIKDEKPFSLFKSKIIHNVYDVPPNGKRGWEYEHDQRNSLRRFGFKPGDAIIYSDCDEIIRDGSVVQKAVELLPLNPLITLDMEMCWYYFNCQVKPGSEFQKDYSMESCFNYRWLMAKIFDAGYINVVKNIYRIREMNLWDKVLDCTIDNAGWHFSNFGTPDSIFKKFASFSHSDDLDNRYHISTNAIRARKERLEDPLGRDVSFTATDIDVPKYVLDNMDKYHENFISV
jgi:hypothetical protein